MKRCNIASITPDTANTPPTIAQSDVKNTLQDYVNILRKGCQKQCQKTQSQSPNLLDFSNFNTERGQVVAKSTCHVWEDVGFPEKSIENTKLYMKNMPGILFSILCASCCISIGRSWWVTEYLKPNNFKIVSWTCSANSFTYWLVLCLTCPVAA